MDLPYAKRCSFQLYLTIDCWVLTILNNTDEMGQLDTSLNFRLMIGCKNTVKRMMNTPI